MRKKIHVLDVMPIIIMLGLFVFFAIGSHGNTITLFNIKNIVIHISMIVEKYPFTSGRYSHTVLSQYVSPH